MSAGWHLLSALIVTGLFTGLVADIVYTIVRDQAKILHALFPWRDDGDDQ